MLAIILFLILIQLVLHKWRLVVSTFYVHYRDMLVALTRIRVDLGYSGEADCFLRAVLYAGEAEITVAMCLYPLRGKGIVALRTYMCAYSALDTVAADD